MKKRIPYLTGFLLLLGIEIFIGSFVRDDFIRPYLGDVLVGSLLCCGAALVFPQAGWVLSALVFCFCAGMEFLQLLNLPERLNLQDSILAIALGSTFDLADLLCYFLGCILFLLVQLLVKNKRQTIK